MKEKDIKNLLLEIKNGKISVESGVKRLKSISYEDIDFAKIDHSRKYRKGFPEVIFAEGKKPEQIAEIASKMLLNDDLVLITRANNEIFKYVKSKIPSSEYNNIAMTITISKAKIKHYGSISIACAGTSDLPVAEEAAETSLIMGSNVKKIYDIGVAGIHRLLDKIDVLNSSNVVIVIAGMEGALPSVIGGLIDKPIIAVPTSIGYGTNFHGITPLLAMLNSCSPGIAVVNIDNGFGAGYIASRINRLIETKK
jgi:pyridinium-3,5-biscarboxylic acid mononucleotide synthase